MFIACGLLSCVLTLQAQTKDGGIDAQMLQQIQKSGLTKSDRALSNAIAQILLMTLLATSVILDL